MNSQLLRKLELLAAGKLAIDREFVFENGLAQVVASLLFVGSDKEVDTEKMKEARKILKKKAGVFSALRSSTELVILARMAMEGDPEKYLSDLIEVFNEFRKGRIFEDQYMVLSSMLIIDRGQKDNAGAIMDKTDEIMRRMNKEHPLLTSSEDLALSSLLAMTDRDVDSIIADMEECYNYAKKEIKIKADSNSIQSLSQILALSGKDIKTCCDKVAALFDEFKAQGAKFGSYIEFPAIATLIDVDMPKEAIVSEVIEAAEWLKQNKGFGSFSMDRKTRLMFCALLASQVFSKSDEDSPVNGAIIANNAIMMIIAEEIAMMVILLCAANSNSN